MYKILVFVFLLTALQGFPQHYRNVQNTAFIRGEKLTFRVAFNSALTGSITGGKASLEVTGENKTISNRSTFHVVGKGCNLAAEHAKTHTKRTIWLFFGKTTVWL